MKIISFFSFKGGVGRTALLTNLGAYWASRGKVVVLMDLMAPGLAYSPLAGPYLYPEGNGLGMSDLIAALKPLTGDPDQDEKAARGAFLPPPHWLLREMHLSHSDSGPGKDQG